jgi:hypothetical protein
VQEALRPILDAELTIRKFEVNTSITHKIGSGKAA